MNIFWTIISATSIFVLGQIIQNFILKPIQDIKVIFVDISHKLKFRANILANSGFKQEFLNVVRAEMRDLASNLESRYLLIPKAFRIILGRFGWLPNNEKIHESIKQLILLSNIGGEKKNEVYNSNLIDKIKENLNIML